MNNDIYGGLRRRDFKDFSIWRALDSASQEKTGSFEERAIQEEFQNKFGPLPGQAFIPFACLQRDNLSSTGTIGGHLVPTPMNDYTAALRGPIPLLQRLGCQVAYGLPGTAAVPRVSTGVTAATGTEGAAVATSTPEFASVNLAPSIASARVRISRLLWKIAPLVESIIRNDLTAAVYREVDRALLFGTGSGGEPTGLLSQVTAGFNTAAAGTTPDLNVFKTLEAAVVAGDGLTGGFAYLTSNGVRKALRSSITNTIAGGYDWQQDPGDGTGLRGFVDGVPAYAASLVPETLTSGTVTAAASPALCGSWSSYMLGWHGAPGLAITVDQVSNPAWINVSAEAFFSGSALQPAAFSKTDNLVLS